MLKAKPEPNAVPLCWHLTNDLEAAVRVELSDIPGAEPPLASLVHEKVLADCVLAFVIAHRYIGAADEDFSPRVGLVCAVITA